MLEEPAATRVTSDNLGGGGRVETNETLCGNRWIVTLDSQREHPTRTQTQTARVTELN